MLKLPRNIKKKQIAEFILNDYKYKQIDYLDYELDDNDSIYEFLDTEINDNSEIETVYETDNESNNELYEEND